MKEVFKYILEQNFKGNISEAATLKLVDLLKENGPEKKSNDSDIAIVGMSASTALSGDINKLWHNIRVAKDCIVDFPDNDAKKSLLSLVDFVIERKK